MKHIKTTERSEKMDTVRKKQMTIIPAKPEYDKNIKVQSKSLRVAAYCRVSTTQEQQESSYEAQVTYYTDKIQNNPNWKMAGIYADDGKSATSMKKRDDFNSLIKDCLAGKVDLVLTKSVSRFARNTVDALQNIRLLKERNIGVIFEKECVNTLEGTGELLITILSSQAQEESRNLSENTRWGIIRKFENGVVIVNHKHFLGYTKNENHELIIIPEEAEIVKRIFRLYLEGDSCYKIAKALTSDGIKTVTGKDVWQASVITRMLQNEKYMGDALLQKTYTVDFLTKKKIFNTGMVPQYYIKDNHEAIIPKYLFLKAQVELTRRSSIYKPAVTKRKAEEKGKYSGKFILSDIMVCKECGQPYRRKMWSRDGNNTYVWRCSNRLKNGKKHCKHSPTLREKPLYEAIMTAVNSMIESKAEFAGTFRENVISVIGSYSNINNPSEFDEQISKLQGMMITLIDENANPDTALEDFDIQYHKVADQIRDLQQKKANQTREKLLADTYDQRLDNVDGCLEQSSCRVLGFDEELVRQLLLSVKVIRGDKLELRFKSGIVVELRMESD